MSKSNVAYWGLTGLFSAMMGASAFAYLTGAPAMVEAFQHLGFPAYFRMELGVAKLLGVVTLLVPAVPRRLKEGAYVGFSIVVVSAALAHLSMGDAFGHVMAPLVALALLVGSWVTWSRRPQASEGPLVSA